MRPGKGPDHLEEVLPHPLGPAGPPPRLVRKASEEGLVKAKKIRTDTTAVEANVHHPTDAGLIYDEMRTLTRLVKKVKALGTHIDFRDRSRSVKKRLLEITKVLRRRITEEMALIGAEVIKATGEVIKDLEGRSESSLKRIAEYMKTVRDRTTPIVEQALEVNAGSLHIPDRLVSLFDPDARLIRRGKPTEFGHKVRLTETEEPALQRPSHRRGKGTLAGVPEAFLKGRSPTGAFGIPKTGRPSPTSG